MKIIKPHAEIINPFERFMTVEQYFECMCKHIENVGRTCYKSEANATECSYEAFIRNLIDRGHESVLEHSCFSVRFVVDRGVSHELVRHRIASFSQESTRYCNYSKDKFGNEITVIEPCFGESFDMTDWRSSIKLSESHYFDLLEKGATPQEARSVLPNSLKTEVVMTANFREWRSFFKLRTSSAAHPQMREVTLPLLLYLTSVCPVIFGDLHLDA